MTASKEVLPINWEQALSSFGTEEVLRQALEMVESMTLDEKLKGLHECVMELAFKKSVHYISCLQGVLSYLAAKKCYEVICQIKEAARTENKETFVEQYLVFLYEMRPLKMFLADVNQKECDLIEIDSYIKETKEKYRPVLKYEAEEQGSRRSVCQSTCSLF